MTENIATRNAGLEKIIQGILDGNLDTNSASGAIWGLLLGSYGDANRSAQWMVQPEVFAEMVDGYRKKSSLLSDIHSEYSRMVDENKVEAASVDIRFNGRELQVLVKREVRS